jgi:hypothetical protein
MPWILRISQTVEGATLSSKMASSPWILRYPQLGFHAPGAGRGLECCGRWGVCRVVGGEMRWCEGSAADRGPRVHLFG